MRRMIKKKMEDDFVRISDALNMSCYPSLTDLCRVYKECTINNVTIFGDRLH